MDGDVRLTPSEIVSGRLFTDPARSAADLLAVDAMLAAVRRVLASALPADPRPLVLQAPEPDGRQHRMVLCDEQRLRAGRDLTLVGFFAEKRAGLDHGPLTTADDELIAEFPAHPGILSYSSLEFADGNWGNLVLVDPPEARDHWRTSARHAYAAGDLAPRHYTVVRLHNGVLPGGVLSDRALVLTRTRYYDFRGPEPWRAVRELRQPP